jgi:hypothetical protein
VRLSGTVVGTPDVKMEKNAGEIEIFFYST